MYLAFLFVRFCRGLQDLFPLCSILGSTCDLYDVNPLSGGEIRFRVCMAGPNQGCWLKMCTDSEILTPRPVNPKHHYGIL